MLIVIFILLAIGYLVVPGLLDFVVVILAVGAPCIGVVLLLEKFIFEPRREREHQKVLAQLYQEGLERFKRQYGLVR